MTGAVSLLCMAVLLVNYLCNEHFISEYKKGQYVVIEKCFQYWNGNKQSE